MKSSIKILIILAICLPVALSAQNKINASLFNHAKMAPDSVEKNYRTLANYLKIPAQNDRETVESIFYWMAINIAYYDNPAFEKTIGDSIAKTTLLTKKSGCEGTARLFREICRGAGIECQVVFGFAEGYSFDEQQASAPNHGWDAVNIDGKWELVDATWGSGGSTKEGIREVYVSEIDMRYFFADPNDFIIDHFPEDSKWQLLENPISKHEFYSDEYELKRLAKLGW
jgi:transglutaminase/protease-like cytokinesis protein 3